VNVDAKFCILCATPLAPIVQVEDSGTRTRLRCPACGWTHWNNPTPVLAAVIELLDRDGQVLLARNAAGPASSFGLVTGLWKRASRRSRHRARGPEETSLTAESVSLIGAYEFLRMNQVIIAYHVAARGGSCSRPSSSTTGPWLPRR
jgi:hypothetical protein